MTDPTPPDRAPADAPPRPPVFDAAFRRSLGELFAWRRDVRHFRTDPVDARLVADLLETASLAPSVGLSQPWRFVLVDDPGRRAAIRAAFADGNAAALAAQPDARAAAYGALKLAGLDAAPVQLAVLADPDPAQGGGLGRMTMPETVGYSAAMAIHTLWLVARAAGLGLGWVSILDPARVVAILDVPERWRLVGYLCLGHPAAETDVPQLEAAGWERRRPVVILER